MLKLQFAKMHIYHLFNNFKQFKLHYKYGCKLVSKYIECLKICKHKNFHCQNLFSKQRTKLAVILNCKYFIYV